jgi:hypothetical protein
VERVQKKKERKKERKKVVSYVNLLVKRLALAKPRVKA